MALSWLRACHTLCFIFPECKTIEKIRIKMYVIIMTEFTSFRAFYFELAVVVACLHSTQSLVRVLSHISFFFLFGVFQMCLYLDNTLLMDSSELSGLVFSSIAFFKIPLVAACLCASATNECSKKQVILRIWEYFFVSSIDCFVNKWAAFFFPLCLADKLSPSKSSSSSKHT